MAKAREHSMTFSTACHCRRRIGGTLNPPSYIENLVGRFCERWLGLRSGLPKSPKKHKPSDIMLRNTTNCILVSTTNARSRSRHGSRSTRQQH
eukprot:scaffold5033_cov247-Pinguiococcus_pyrenoidosus.AAC.1